MPPKTEDLDGPPEEQTTAESFETAVPVTVPREPEPAKPAERQPRNLPASAPDRSPPHSAEAEEHVIAVCLLDGRDTISRARREGLTPEYFYFPANRLLFGIINELNDAGKQVMLETVAEELKTRRQLEAIGGFAYLMQVTGKIPTTAHAGYFIETVREKYLRRELIKQATQTVEDSYNFTGGLDKLLTDAQRRMTELAVPSPAITPPKPITSFAYPSDDDPNMLLGSEDYLGRGGGLLFVSHAGAGKSSWAMDACMMWALGKAWMQIKAHQPRKILIIQAEDSDRYIGKIFSSFAHVNKLTPDELSLLAKNCVIVRLKGVSGPAFFAELTRYTQQHQPDLVVINPIYLYAEGDITRSEFAQPFLLGLDRANKEEKWAYILIHHTGKPQAKGKDGTRAVVEDWESAYMGFGSSYLANWPRCTILLEPVQDQPGSFQIKLGKGGYNAGVTKTVDQGAGSREEPVTRIAVRHSREKMEVNGRERAVYYWELDDRPVPVAPRNPLGSGRKIKYPPDDFICIIPLGQKNGEGFRSLHRKAAEMEHDLSMGTFNNILHALQDSGIVIKDKTVPQMPKYYRPAPDQPTLV